MWSSHNWLSSQSGELHTDTSYNKLKENAGIGTIRRAKTRSSELCVLWYIIIYRTHGPWGPPAPNAKFGKQRRKDEDQRNQYYYGRHEKVARHALHYRPLTRWATTHRPLAIAI